MRIGIDCDGVLRDLIPCITDSIKETHPQHTDKILEPNSWNWEDWLPFWTEERAEELGCNGTHTHDEDGNLIYMPCSTHEEYERRLAEQNDDT